MFRKMILFPWWYREGRRGNSSSSAAAAAAEEEEGTEGGWREWTRWRARILPASGEEKSAVKEGRRKGGGE